MIQLVKNNCLAKQLPEPSAEQLKNSELLTTVIINKINHNNNWLSFRDYMTMALYDQSYGYYTSGNRKIGPDGDFITAPELGPLFAYSLARQIQPILAQHPDFNILEFGAGSGQLAIDLLTELEKLNSLPQNYYILDISPELTHRQQTAVKNLPDHLNHLKNKITWLTALPEDNTFNGIILANELIDAMPVNLFEISDNKISELGLSTVNNTLIWQAQKPDNNLINYLEEYIFPIIKFEPPSSTLPTSYISEVNLMAKDWLTAVSNCLAQGLIIIIDYGFKRSEYYHHDRSMGTLMCHYKHFAHQDPLLYPGLQDITAHVDFTSLAETAVENNLEVASYLNQANFLLANQVVDYFNNNINNQNIFLLKQQLKKLTSPSEMGELFKVLLLHKDLDISFFSHLQPFDKRYEL